MTIKEVEEKTGLKRSNIRFYEKEKLVIPERKEENGYRAYTEKDVEDIKRIAYLRTLAISIDDIRRVIEKEAELSDILKVQVQSLKEQAMELDKARISCENMLRQENISFEQLDTAYYVSDLDKHWEESRNMLKKDSLGFFYLCGGTAVWGILAVVSLMAAVCSFAGLPREIPVQWRNGMASSLADKWFIFAYPAACIIIRFMLRPFIRRWFWNYVIYSDAAVDYAANYVCFVAISGQVFTILFVNGIVRNITAVFILDAVVLAVSLLIEWKRLLAAKQK